MLNKIFSTACLLIVAWLTVQMNDMRGALNDVQSSVVNVSSVVRSDFARNSDNAADAKKDVLARLDELIEVGTKGGDELEQAKKALAAKEKETKQIEWQSREKDKRLEAGRHIASLQSTVLAVYEAQFLAIGEKGVEAAEALLATKSSIWKLSSKWPESRDTLRGLMAPIDILAGKWKRSEFDRNSGTIRKILQETLVKQIASGAS